MMKCPKDWDIYRRDLATLLHPRYIEAMLEDFKSSMGDASNGCLVIPIREMRIVFSNGYDWEHVSVSHPDRCPDWHEMDEVKRRFWSPEDTVMQLHVPIKDHRNCHPYCLHLWRPLHGEIPRPPGILVAPASNCPEGS